MSGSCKEEDYPCCFCGWIDGEHAGGCPYHRDNDNYEEKVRCYTQGGGVVEYDDNSDKWIFVGDPPMGFEIGDFMPDEWGIGGRV